MILTGKQILLSFQEQAIKIEPFDETHISTNSYDLTLGEKYIRYIDDVLDPAKENRYSEHTIPKEGLILNKGDFILAETRERIGSNQFVPLIHGKSGVARKGLFIHVTADLIDVGYFGKLTLQLFATQKIILYPNMKIAQLSFWKTHGEITLYNGKYQNGDGPQASRIQLDTKL